MDHRLDWIPRSEAPVSVPPLPPAAAEMVGEGIREKSGDKDKKKIPEPFNPIDPRDLAGLPVPPRRWIVPDWLPIGYTTALYGDGGTGKTLLAQMLMTSCATGLPWLGIPIEKRKVYGLFCEDDEDELHRRQDAINAQYGINFSDLENMRWVSGVGADNLLFTFDARNVGTGTDRYIDLTNAAGRFGATLVLIDTAADTFGGNENDRSQVRQYIGAGLNKLARSLDGGKGGGVLLNAHPSRSGMSVTGDMDGGSTGWSNTVRSRWSLVRPKAEDDTPAGSDERILSRRKANYAAIGTEIKLRYAAGILIPSGAHVALSGVINHAAVEMVFLQLLDEAQRAGRHVSESRNSGNYGPTLFAKSPNRQGYTKRDFTGAMERLFSVGQIIVEQYGRLGDRHRHVVLVPREDDAEGDKQ